MPPGLTSAAPERGTGGGGPAVARPVSPVDGLIPLARDAFPAALLFLGLLHVVFGERLTRMLPVWPEGLPGRPWWAHGAGVLLASVSALVLARRRSRWAPLALVVVLLLPVLSLQLPRALPTARFGNEWLNVLKWLALSTGPLLLASHRPARGAAPGRDRVIATGAGLAPWFLGAFMLGSAYMHLRYAEFVARLIQPWMPWRVFWTYFAGVALAAGALGLQIPRTARLAALLTSLMIFLWFFLVHTPRMLIDPAGPGGWSEMAESLAFSAMAFLLATRPPPDSAAKPPNVVSIRQAPDRRL